MAESRRLIEDDVLEEVVGGLFVFHKKSQYVTFNHPDGSVSNHDILNYDAAWSLCATLEAQKIPEEQIFTQLVNAGYIKA